MMHKKNFVAAIKVGGKVLRESSDRVSLPFGSEYSILLKNLDSVRVQAKVHIDGKDATEGTWLVIEPNSSLEIERFIRNRNFDKGNRFKFIERTQPIEDARGIKVDDGLIRIEYKKEYVAPTVTTNIVRTQYVYDYDWHYYHPRPWVPYRPYWYDDITCSNSLPQTQNNASLTNSFLSSSRGMSGSVKCAALNCTSHNLNDAGITVPGSESQQKFTAAPHFATESQTEVMVLHLIGYTPSGVKTKKPITVDVKPVCVTCNKKNKATSRFCSQCGTALEI